jgi:hypothetical protein
VASAVTLTKIQALKKHLDKALPMPQSQLALPFKEEDIDDLDEGAAN